MSRLYLSKPCALFPLFAHGTAGAVGARLSLRPLQERGTTRCSNPGENLLREGESLPGCVLPSSTRHAGYGTNLPGLLLRERRPLRAVPEAANGTTGA